MSFYLVTLEDDSERVVIDADPLSKEAYGIDLKRVLASGHTPTSVVVTFDGQASYGAPTISGTVLAVEVDLFTKTPAVGVQLALRFDWITSQGARNGRTVWLNVVNR